MCAEALRCTAYNNRNCLAGASLQNIRARLFAHRAHAHRKEELAVDRDAKVRAERQQVRHNARELLREAGRYKVEASGLRSQTKVLGQIDSPSVAKVHVAPL